MTSLEQSQSLGTSRTIRRFPRARLVTVTCLVIVVAIPLLLLLWPRPGVDAQLQAIDVAHAVPDDQNAAKDYLLLVSNGAGALLDPQLLAEDIRNATLAGPWRGTDFPPAAKWVEERRAIIDPLTQKPFVYRPAGDSLILYAVGPNGIDDGGQSGGDYCIWPSSRR